MSSAILFTTLLDKKSPTTRIARGTMVADQAPKSPLYALAEVQVPADNVIDDTATLRAAVDGNNEARGAYKKARATLVAALARWDASYDVLISTGEKHCVTEDDAAGLALPMRAGTKNPLAMPLSITCRQDHKRDLLRIHVHRAKGMKSTRVEVSNNPSDPASWRELPGSGAIHNIPSPTPGEWAVRAASSTAKGRSNFTLPVSIIVK